MPLTISVMARYLRSLTNGRTSRRPSQERSIAMVSDSDLDGCGRADDAAVVDDAHVGVAGGSEGEGAVRRDAVDLGAASRARRARADRLTGGDARDREQPRAVDRD